LSRNLESINLYKNPFTAETRSIKQGLPVKKTRLSAFLAVILIGGLILVGTVHLAKTQNGTNVTAIINSDANSTSYTVSASPEAVITQVWNYTTTGSFGAPTVVSGYIFIGDSSNSLFALNATNGATIWDFRTEGFVGASPTVANGVVYAGDNSDNLYAINASTGTEIWKYTSWGFPGTPTVADGRVYVHLGSITSNVYCLNASNGNEIWNYTTQGSISYPVVEGGYVYISSGQPDNNIYALNASTGAKIWNFTTGISPMSPIVNENTLYVDIGDNDHVFYALDASSGIQKWNYTTNGSTGSMYVVAGDRIYRVGYGGANCTVYALNALTGNKIWSYITEGPVEWDPIISGNVLYVASGGSTDGNVYALDASTGSLIWKHNVGTYWYYPAVGNGTVYIIEKGGNVYALDALTGAEIWDYQVAEYGPLVVGQYIYIFSTYSSGSSSMSTIYALDQTNVAPSPTPTPTPTPTPSPSPSPTPTATPSPTPTPMSTQISISVDASSTAVGAAVNVNGRLSDSNGNPLPDKSVTLSYAVAGSTSWVPIASGTTNATGEYNIQWVNTASGTFTLKAEWNGDADYPGASSTTTLIFLPYENQNVFFVESNSTVSALAFNSTSSELSFTVSGSSGTAGYVKVTIAKSLVSSVQNVKAYLDENQLDVAITSNEDSWLLSFTYMHSTHQVRINLANAAGDTFPGIEYWILIAVVIVIAVAGVASFIVWRKKKKP